MSGNNILRAIQMYDFYLYELDLYLDTHPTDTNALALFQKYNEARRSAYETYTEKYGPITAKDFSGGNCFNWVDDPWPWERSAN